MYFKKKIQYSDTGKKQKLDHHETATFFSISDLAAKEGEKNFLFVPKERIYC